MHVLARSSAIFHFAGRKKEFSVFWQYHQKDGFISDYIWRYLFCNCRVSSWGPLSLYCIKSRETGLTVISHWKTLVKYRNLCNRKIFWNWVIFAHFCQPLSHLLWLNTIHHLMCKSDIFKATIWWINEWKRIFQNIILTKLVNFSAESCFDILIIELTWTLRNIFSRILYRQNL